MIKQACHKGGREKKSHLDSGLKPNLASTQVSSLETETVAVLTFKWAAVLFRAITALRGQKKKNHIYRDLNPRKRDKKYRQHVFDHNKTHAGTSGFVPPGMKKGKIFTRCNFFMMSQWEKKDCVVCKHLRRTLSSKVVFENRNTQKKKKKTSESAIWQIGRKYRTVAKNRSRATRRRENVWTCCLF